MSDEPRKPPSFFKRAFFNQYNAILLGGSGLMALATFSGLPLLVGGGLEVLWLTFGPDASPFKKWAKAQEAKEAQEKLQKASAAALAALEPEYVDRFYALRTVAENVQKTAADNKSLEARLLADEMAKVGHLLLSFLQLAGVHQRLRHYLEECPGTEIEADMARNARKLQKETSTAVQASLRQALDLAQKRKRQHDRIEESFRAVDVKMDTLEKSFSYLSSHIMGIGTQSELSEELDGLVLGVESVEELENETNDMITDLRQARAAQAQGSANRR